MICYQADDGTIRAGGFGGGGAAPTPKVNPREYEAAQVSAPGQSMAFSTDIDGITEDAGRTFDARGSYTGNARNAMDEYSGILQRKEGESGREYRDRQETAAFGYARTPGQRAGDLMKKGLLAAGTGLAGGIADTSRYDLNQGRNALSDRFRSARDGYDQAADRDLESNRAFDATNLQNRISVGTDNTHLAQQRDQSDIQNRMAADQWNTAAMNQARSDNVNRAQQADMFNAGNEQAVGLMNLGNDLEINRPGRMMEAYPDLFENNFYKRQLLGLGLTPGEQFGWNLAGQGANTGMDILGNLANRALGGK